MPFYERLDELGTADGNKQYAGLVGHGPGEQHRNLCYVSSRRVFPRSATSGRPLCTADEAHESPMEGCKVSDQLRNAALEAAQLVIIEALIEIDAIKLPLCMLIKCANPNISNALFAHSAP
jgi:hypothetical protein